MSDKSRTDQPTPSKLASAGRLDFQEVLTNPAAWFAAPQEIVDYGDFDDQQKRQLLETWETDARNEAAATDENMAGDEDDTILDDIVDAIRNLGEPTGRDK